MDPFNKAQTEKVWRRVLDTSGAGAGMPGSENQRPVPRESGPAAGPEPAARHLLAIIGEIRASAACYSVLSRRTGGRTANLLRRLYEEKQNQVDCLLGLYCLLYGKRPSLEAVSPPAQEPLEAALRKCAGAELRILAAFESAAAQPAYGGIFSDLAQKTREHCRLILELLGRNSR